ncbi:MAG: three-Cys-motif partner protein TcmP [Acidobacteriota bacterium]
MPSDVQLDEIGPWSEIKLEILKEYASAYSRILAAQKNPSLSHIYIEGFAGPGVHLSKSTQEFVPGSPLNALAVQPPFREYHLIDIDEDKVDTLRHWVGGRKDVYLHPGNCNKILLASVFPRVQYRDYRRGLCILDPYGLHLNWTVISTAGKMKSIDMFLNFPIADMNRNVLRRDPERVDASQAARMNAYWGGEIWRQVAYETTGSLFGIPEKVSNERVAEAFRQRLKEVAGFARVPTPLAMKNRKGATVYYLFFASQKDVAEDIVLDIFGKYSEHGGANADEFID